MEKQAAIVDCGVEKEVRCAGCGKLLFKFSEKDVDKSQTRVIIKARCPRNSCKTDNVICL